MKLLHDITVTIARDGKVWSNIYNTSADSCVITDAELEHLLRKAQHRFRSKHYSDASVECVLAEALRRIGANITYKTATTDTNASESDKDIAKSVCERLIAFFKEFGFEPNFRFVNTLQNQNKAQAFAYVANYFKLTDNSFANSIIEKITSAEFLNIINDMSKLTCNKQINKRFKLYYGSQGTGKTTLAMQEADNNVMVCHSAMLPSDLMEDFAFDDGKATFKPSALYKAMIDGHAIVLDEINLLPFESLRFLQSILDGKKQFEYKGQTVNIADGFQIIGTMNLQVNGITYALPEPLVDRAMELRRFELTAEQLTGALI